MLQLTDIEDEQHILAALSQLDDLLLAPCSSNQTSLQQTALLTSPQSCVVCVSSTASASVSIASVLMIWDCQSHSCILWPPRLQHSLSLDWCFPGCEIRHKLLRIYQECLSKL